MAYGTKSGKRVRHAGTGLAVLAMLVQAGPVAAQEAGKRDRAASFGKLVECRALRDAAGRLACYDREVAALDVAEKNKDVVIVDRAQVRSARRTLFGLNLPRIGLLDDKDGRDAIKELDTTFRSAGRLADGRVTFTVEDGARWTQTDDFAVPGALKTGGKVRITRGALGSYFARPEGRPGFKVERQNR